MQNSNTGRFALMLSLAAALLASPELADAQGKSKDKNKDKDRARPELVRRESRDEARAQARQRARVEQALRERRGDRDRDDLEWDDRVLRDERYDDRRRGVPPGWCKGKGNPHNTVENCGPGARRDGRYDRDVIYDRDGRYDDRNRYGSYEQAHEDFHRRHDRECRMRAAERPLDIQWQLRVRSECKQRHDDWHYRVGRRHD